jgi:UDP-N-acetylmuramoyl-L-alanyl-D-glutamate--2,6-diaminopimelate ligase
MDQIAELLQTATGITCHSEEVCPGDIFVAIRGRSDDGNKYASQAACRGASAIVTDTNETLSQLGIPVHYVDNARAVCARLASEFYRHPSAELSLVGVTGTNGKTTIVSMLEHMYRTAGLSAGMIGTVSVNIGGYSLPSKLTTPDSISLQQFLRQMRQQNVTHAAMEVSAQGMELNRVDHVKFACGILTNVSPDHLDFHGDFTSYLAAKRLFPSFLAGAPLIINAADAQCQAIAQSYGGPVITAGVNMVADISVQVLRTSRRGSIIQLQVNRTINGLEGYEQALKHLRLSVPGLHNVENAMLAAIAALLQGVNPAAIARALACFGGVERRFKIAEHDGCTVIDDTALNPGSIDAVFETVRQFRYQRMVVVNAIRGCRGPAINAANALTLLRWQRELPFTLIITASYDQTSAADRVSQQEKIAFLSEFDRPQSHYLYTDTLSEAILAARSATRSGDLLLLIGAQGMDHGFSLLVPCQA